MAKKTEIKLLDDLDGTPAIHEDVVVSFNGQSVTLDLNQANMDKLAAALAPFMEAGTKVAKVTAGRSGNVESMAAQRAVNDRIRSWAKRSGLEVAERGRISGDIVAQAKAANFVPLTSTEKPAQAKAVGQGTPAPQKAAQPVKAPAVKFQPQAVADAKLDQAERKSGATTRKPSAIKATAAASKAVPAKKTTSATVKK